MENQEEVANANIKLKQRITKWLKDRMMIINQSAGHSSTESSHSGNTSQLCGSYEYWWNKKKTKKLDNCNLYTASIHCLLICKYPAVLNLTLSFVFWNTHVLNPLQHFPFPLPPPKGVQFTLLHELLNISEYKHKQIRFWGGKGVFTHCLFF